MQLRSSSCFSSSLPFCRLSCTQHANTSLRGMLFPRNARAGLCSVALQLCPRMTGYPLFDLISSISSGRKPSTLFHTALIVISYTVPALSLLGVALVFFAFNHFYQHSLSIDQKYHLSIRQSLTLTLCRVTRDHHELTTLCRAFHIYIRRLAGRPQGP